MASLILMRLLVVALCMVVQIQLQDAVREHNLIAFRQACKRFEEAVPGSLKLVPQSELRTVIESDCEAMEGMVLGEAPRTEWVMEQIRDVEAKIN